MTNPIPAILALAVVLAGAAWPARRRVMRRIQAIYEQEYHRVYLAFAAVSAARILEHMNEMAAAARQREEEA